MITVEEVKQKTIERFWSKIKFGEPNECWEWERSLKNKGYGYFKVGSCSIPSYRYLYHSLFPDCNKKLSVCHNCPDGDNPSCVNPNHLWLGTQADNNLDMWDKGRGVLPPAHIGTDCHLSKLTEEMVKEIKKRLANMETQQSIADDFGVTRANIGYINQGKSWKHVEFERTTPKRVRGNILSEEQVGKIKLMLSIGKSCTELSKEYKVSVSTVSSIKTGINWGHVKI